MTSREEHKCYLCHMFGPNMWLFGESQDDGVPDCWLCEDPAWCRSRAVANRLEADGLAMIATVETSD